MAPAVAPARSDANGFSFCFPFAVAPDGLDTVGGGRVAVVLVGETTLVILESIDGGRI